MTKIAHLGPQDKRNTTDSAHPDATLGFHWKAKTWGVDVLPRRLSGTELRVAQSVVANLAMEAIGQGRAVSYSRNRNWYPQRRRYLGTPYTYRSVVSAMDLLAAEGLIDNAVVSPGSRGLQSTATLRPWVLDALGSTPDDLTFDPVELVRLKNADGHLIPYRDTEKTRRWRRHLQEINEAIASVEIDLPIAHAERDGRVLRVEGATLYPDRKALYRVSRGGWGRGARLHGGWWQGVPKRRNDTRASLTIDGGATVEPDFPSLHPRLLYLLASEPEPECDPYTVDGFTRAQGKVAWNVLLNAASYGAAIGAVATNNDAGPPIGRARAIDLVDKLKALHGPIADYFHRDIGARLQAIDADICELVMLKLSRRGVVALPVHDSFIVSERHRAVTEETMVEAFDVVVRRTVGDMPYKVNGLSPFGLTYGTRGVDGVSCPSLTAFPLARPAANSVGELDGPNTIKRSAEGRSVVLSSPIINDGELVEYGQAFVAARHAAGASATQEAVAFIFDVDLREVIDTEAGRSPWSQEDRDVILTELRSYDQSADVA